MLKLLNIIYKYPLINIIIILIITIILGFGLSLLKMNNDMSKMLPSNNPSYLSDEKIKKVYNTSDTLFIGIESKNGNIITVENINTISNITNDIENIKVPDLKSGKKMNIINILNKFLNKDNNKLNDDKINNDNSGDTEDDYSSLFEDTKDDYSTLFEETDPDNETFSFDGTEETSENEYRIIIDDVQSIANIEVIEGINSGIDPVSLEDYIPQNENELMFFKEKLISWDLFEGVLYSDDFKASAISVIFGGNANDDEQAYVYKEIKKIIKKYEDNNDLTFYLSGQPVLKTIINNYMINDLLILIPFVIIVLLVILYMSFRSIRNVLMPLITVCISTIWTLGIMGYMGIKLSLIGVIIPVLLIAIGSAYGIHIITHYIEDKNKRNINNKQENKLLIIETLNKVIFPVFLAALTTCFGFISLAFMEIKDIRIFGIFVSAGVLIELVLSIIFIPSLMMLLKPKQNRNQNNPDELSFFEKGLLKFARSLKDKKIYFIIGFIILILFLINGAVKLNVNFDTLKFFKLKSDLVKSTLFMDYNLAGSNTIYINITGEQDGDMSHPEILIAMDGLSEYLVNQHEEIGKVIGFNDMIKRMNQVMNFPENKEHEAVMKSSFTYEDFLSLVNNVKQTSNSVNIRFEDFINYINKNFNYNGQNYYEIPFNPDKYNIDENDILNYANDFDIDPETIDEDKKNEIKILILKQLITQYLLLYSGNMDDMISEDQLKPISARVTVILRQVESQVLQRIRKDIINYTDKNFPKGYKIELGGTAVITNELNNIVVRGQVISFIIAIIIVFLIVAISYRSFIAGLISTIPISLSILINFAIMGYLNLDLNIATALIASLSIGIGIDYTIHFLSFYKQHYKKYHDIDKALEMTFCSSGKAILFNALSVGLGFAVLLFSSTRILGTFGILITLVMISSSMGALTIIPIILEMFKPKFVEK